jgi:hypothetical protein
VAGRKGHKMNDYTLPGSLGLWPENFAFKSLKKILEFSKK